MVAEAAAHEAFGDHEGIPAVLAEAAVLWLVAGEPERARALLLEVAGAGLAALPRELDWLMIVTQLTAVAADTGERELTDEGRRLLEPYAARAVVNGGALVFFGAVDDGYLAHAAESLARGAEAVRWARSGRRPARPLGARNWRPRRAPVAPQSRHSRWRSPRCCAARATTSG